MIKKALVALVAAGVVAIPLAGVAGAGPDPDKIPNPDKIPCSCPDSPGMPGTENILGRPPGYWVKAFATTKDNRDIPSMAKIFGQFGPEGDPYKSPGDFINDGAPPKQGTAADAADQPAAP